MSVTIVGPLDSQGNVKVHEQGMVGARDVDNPALQPFQQRMDINFSSNEPAACAELDVSGRANKRLVIEFVSAELPGDEEIVRVLLITTVADISVAHSLMATARVIDG